VGKFSWSSNHLGSNQGDGAFVADVAANAAVTAPVRLEEDPFPFPDDDFDGTEVDTFDAIRRTFPVINNYFSGKLGIDLDGVVPAHPQTLGAPQAKIGLGQSPPRGFVQNDGLAGTSLQAFAAMFGTLFQGSYQPQLLAAPMNFALRRRAGFRALALVHPDFREKGGQPVMLREDALDLPVIGQGHCPQGAEMGADLAQHAAPGVDVDFQLGFAGNDGHRLPGADQRADVALDANLFIQAQLHLVHIHPQGQFQAVGSFPFAYLGKHGPPKSRRITSRNVNAVLPRPRKLFFFSLGFQTAVKFPGSILNLLAAQSGFQVGELGQQKVEFIARLEIRALVTVVQPPVQGAAANGAILMAPAILAARTLRMGLEPFQALAQFRKTKNFFPGKTMEPPVAPEAAQVFLEPGNRVQKGGVAQLAIVT
jgi:hypothetical protein